MDLTEIYKGTVKVIEENAKDGILKVLFPFCLADKKNTNGRTYPLAILEREVAKINQKIADKDSVFGFVGHPKNPLGNLEDVSHLIEKMSINENVGFGEAKILADSVRGKHLKIILQAGGSLNASMRGTGTVSNGVVNEDYSLLSVDFVTAGSFGKDVRFDKSGIIEGQQQQLTEEQLMRLYGEAESAGYRGTFVEFKKLRDERKNLSESERKAEAYINDEAGVSGHREGANNGNDGFVNGSGQVDLSVNHRCLGRFDT